MIDRVSETPHFDASSLIIRLTLIERIKRNKVIPPRHNSPVYKQAKIGDQ